MWIVFATLVVAVLVVRHFANRWGDALLRNRLATVKGLEANFRDMELSFFPPTVSAHSLKFYQTPRTDVDPPIYHCDFVKAQLEWRHLLRGQLVGTLQVVHPKVAWVLRHATKDEYEREKEKKARGEQGTKRSPLQELTHISNIMPEYRVNRLDVQQAEFLFQDTRDVGAPKIWAHEIQLTLENFSKTHLLANEYPTVLALNGVVQKSGKLSIFLTVDSAADTPDIVAQVQLLGLPATEIRSLLKAKTEVVATAGNLDVYAQMRSRDGDLRGQIVTFFEDGDFTAGQDTFSSRVKAAIGDIALGLLDEKDSDGHNVLYAVLPFRSRLEKDGIGALTGFVKTMSNSLLEAVTDKFPGAEKGPLAAVRARMPPLVEGEGTKVLPSRPETLFQDGTVERMQDALKARGLLNEKFKPGTVEDATRRALIEHQKQQGISQTGMPDGKTLELLGIGDLSVRKKLERKLDDKPPPEPEDEKRDANRKPADSTPADPKPADAKRADPEGAETKPADSKR